MASLTFSLLKPPLSTTAHHPKFRSLSSTFSHGTTNFSNIAKLSALSLSSPPRRPATSLPVIKAMRSMEGVVVCSTSDKTVAVVVTRLAPHPKYKRRVRIKKKYQAHDPDNKFKVGDWVQLQKCRPISKMKAFLAVTPPPRKDSRLAQPAPDDLDLPLQSQQAEENANAQ